MLTVLTELRRHVNKVETNRKDIATPVIVLNFKTYAEATGDKAVKMAHTCEEVAKSSGVNIVVAPQSPDIYRVASMVDIPVFAQHLDAISPGSFTGHILAECLKENGATGTLLNHSEKRLTLAEIDACLASAMRAGLATIICTNNISTTSAAAALSPDFVAVEPPELIGTGIPVSRADPGIVRESVKAVKQVSFNVKVLCGAGISKGEDVSAALELGAEGVLLASGIIKAKDPKAALLELVSGI
jgi:triosephosphate isomerase